MHFKYAWCSLLQASKAALFLRLKLFIRKMFHRFITISLPLTIRIHYIIPSSMVYQARWPTQSLIGWDPKRMSSDGCASISTVSTLLSISHTTAISRLLLYYRSRCCCCFDRRWLAVLLCCSFTLFT